MRGVVALLAATLSLGTCIGWVLSKRQSCLIAQSRIFLVSARTERIIGHIPFDQVESVHYHHGDDESLVYSPGVTIRVRKERGGDVFWPWLLPQDTDIVIEDRYVRRPDELRQMIRRRWQKHKLR